MKKRVVLGAVVIALGLLIALGPQFLFKVCSPVAMSMETSDKTPTDGCGEGGDACGCSGSTAVSFPICHWSAQAEIGMGLLIAALGACMIVFVDIRTHLGLLIGVFLASIIALAIPNMLIGGCGMITMQCRKAAFPALSIESAILLIFSAVMLTVMAMQKPQDNTTVNASQNSNGSFTAGM